MKNKAIKLWSEEERPREKLKLHGEETLTDAELLAIMLGSGTKEKNVVELSKEIPMPLGLLPNAVGIVSQTAWETIYRTIIH